MEFSSDRVAMVIAACETFIADKDDAWSLSRPAAMFIYQIALLRHARNILEIGTSYGHSGLFLADAAHRNQGRFTTVDKDLRKVEIARKFFADAGLDTVTTIIPGTAPEVLGQAPGGIDLLFIDATKTEQDAYFDALWPRLAVPAVIVTDNATNSQAKMAPFLRRLRTDARLISNLIPIGNGMELTLRMK